MFKNVVIFSENPASISRLLTFKTEAKAKAFVKALILTFVEMNKFTASSDEIDEVLNSDNKEFYLDESYIVTLVKSTSAREYLDDEEYDKMTEKNFFKDMF